MQARKRALSRDCICQHLDVGHPSLQKCEKHVSVVYTTHFMVFYYSSPRCLQQCCFPIMYNPACFHHARLLTLSATHHRKESPGHYGLSPTACQPSCQKDKVINDPFGFSILSLMTNIDIRNIHLISTCIS